MEAATVYVTGTRKVIKYFILSHPKFLQNEVRV